MAMTMTLAREETAQDEEDDQSVWHSYGGEEGKQAVPEVIE